MGHVWSICGRYSDHRLGERLATLVAAQYGVVSRAQLLELGFTPAAIRHRVRTGHLIPIYRGVYAVGRSDLSPNGHRMAAALACGEGAVLSHMSASVHWELLQSAATVIHVTIPSHRRIRAQPPIRVHRSHLDPTDTTLHERIPVTTPMRTLLDLGEVVAPDRVREAFEATVRHGYYDHTQALSLIARGTGRQGLKQLLPLIAEKDDDPQDFRSNLERRFLGILRGAGLPLPAMNAVVEGFTVDAYWPEYRLVVELDSYGFHSSPAQFEEDRRRTEILQNAGIECAPLQPGPHPQRAERCARKHHLRSNSMFGRRNGGIMRPCGPGETGDD